MKVEDVLKRPRREWYMKGVEITKITDEEDKWLEGQTGRLTTPFKSIVEGVIGVWLDNRGVFNDMANLLKEDEIEFIKEEK